MNRRQLLATLTGAAGAFAQPRGRKPNIVLILADDLGYADIGPFSTSTGPGRPETPHLDRMAAEGVRLTDFYVAQAVCSASRMALLTGAYSNRVGITGALNHTAKHGINPSEMTIAEVLALFASALALDLGNAWALIAEYPLLMVPLSLLAALAAMLTLADRSAQLSPDFLSEVVLWALSAADVSMVLVLAFVLARNVVKLIVERRRGLPFARFRSKLVGALLVMTLIPALLVLFVGVITGTYSTVYVAGALVVDWTQYVEGRLRARKKGMVKAGEPRKIT